MSYFYRKWSIIEWWKWIGDGVGMWDSVDGAMKMNWIWAME